MSSLCRLGPRKGSVDEFSVLTGPGKVPYQLEDTVQTGRHQVWYQLDEDTVLTGAVGPGIRISWRTLCRLGPRKGHRIGEFFMQTGSSDHVP